MAPSDAWHANNTRFVAGGVAWVRAKLEALVAASGDAESKRRTSHAKTISTARAAMDKHAANKNHVPALVQLARRLNLSAFEQNVLLLCTAMALDLSLPMLCAAASADRGKTYPTFALAMRLFDDEAWEAFAPSGPLRHWRLIEIHQVASEPLIAAALRADERIVNYVKGLNEVDDRVAGGARPLRPASETPHPPSHKELCDRLEASIRYESRDGACPVIQLFGAHAHSKREIACDLSRRLGTRLWRLSAASLSALGAEWDAFGRLLLRESLLLDAALYIDCDEVDATAEAPTPPSLARLLERLGGMLIFLAVRDPLTALDRPSVHVHVGKPTTGEQRETWLRLLGPQYERTAGILAGQFDLDTALIERVAARAEPAGDGEADLTPLLWREAREAVRPRVLGLAVRVDARADWDDLVLVAARRGLLKELAAQIKHQWTVYEEWGFARRLNRGLGIGALFSGESGTGKTMAAEVIANDIKLDLYRIDLASVVSKYIGETEKNLRRVFDAFDDGGAILFFDEADALFGKRSEVKDSHDRYANIEINYLLQRMEAYRGLVILATNRKSALDQAFMRRLRFVIDFPYPTAAERAQIWEKVFPPETPRESLDFERLARLGLSGGNIQSVALNASFRAASENRRVGMEQILGCARAELMKLGLPVNEADFQLPAERSAPADTRSPE